MKKLTMGEYAAPEVRIAELSLEGGIAAVSGNNENSGSTDGTFDFFGKMENGGMDWTNSDNFKF